MTDNPIKKMLVFPTSPHVSGTVEHGRETTPLRDIVQIYHDGIARNTSILAKTAALLLKWDSQKLAALDGIISWHCNLYGMQGSRSASSASGLGLEALSDFGRKMEDPAWSAAWQLFASCQTLAFTSYLLSNPGMRETSRTEVLNLSLRGALMFGAATPEHKAVIEELVMRTVRDPVQAAAALQGHGDILALAMDAAQRAYEEVYSPVLPALAKDLEAPQAVSCGPDVPTGHVQDIRIRVTKGTGVERLLRLTLTTAEGVGGFWWGYDPQAVKKYDSELPKGEGNPLFRPCYVIPPEVAKSTDSAFPAHVVYPTVEAAFAAVERYKSW